MNDELIAEALIGDEAKKFLESDLGKVIIGLADQKTEEARIGLESVDPEDRATILKLQNQAAFGRQFKAWLSELFNAGEQALEVIKHESQE